MLQFSILNWPCPLNYILHLQLPLTVSSHQSVAPPLGLIHYTHPSHIPFHPATSQNSLSINCSVIPMLSSADGINPLGLFCFTGLVSGVFRLALMVSFSHKVPLPLFRLPPSLPPLPHGQLDGQICRLHHQRLPR